MDRAKVQEKAEKVALEAGADILVYNGDLRSDTPRRFIDLLSSRRRRKNVIMLLTTPGGDPDAAFKIGRALQNSYERVIIVVPGWCKSAGTLVAIAAHELVITDRGELGPLDIQIAKADEILEFGSGLTVDAALKTLETTASRMLLNLMMSIRRDTAGRITTRTAADLAAKLVVGLLDPIYHQIDPIKIGENSRAMNITKGYGHRLNIVSRNLKSAQALDWLVSLYPDHSFVIDRQEAKGLFTNVMEPTPALTELIDVMGADALVPSARLARDGAPFIEYLSSETRSAPRRAKVATSSAAPKTRASRKSARKRANGRTAPPA